MNALRLTWYRFRTTFRHRLGGYVALALLIGLVASVRRRRRDFALLKTLGFTRRQANA